MVNLYTVGLYQIDTDIKDGDSNEVVAAKGVIKTFVEKNGVSDEMSHAEIDFINELYPYAQAAYEVLSIRND